MTATVLKLRRRVSGEEEPEWFVWALVIVLLGVALVARTIVLSRTSTFAEGGISVKYPVGWVGLSKQHDRELLAVGEHFESDLFPARFSVLQMPATAISANAESLGDLALLWSDRGARDLLAYKVTGIEPVKVRGQDAVRIDYVYVAEPVLATPNGIPVVARGSDVLIRHGDTMTIARLLAASDAFEGLGQTWDRILGSLVLQ